MSDQGVPVLDGRRLLQVAMVVPDIAQAAQLWSALLGVSAPEIIVTDELERAQTEYYGKPTPARAKLAFFELGPVTLELIEPLGEQSTWHDQLAAAGPSLHHIAFETDNMRQTLAALKAQGIALIQRGEYEGGRYAYVDGLAQLGATIELLEND